MTVKVSLPHGTISRTEGIQRDRVAALIPCKKIVHDSAGIGERSAPAETLYEPTYEDRRDVRS